MTKTFFATGLGFGAALILFTTLPLFAQTSDATKIACVGAAVNTREQTLTTGMAAFTSKTSAAYAARAGALQSAYTKTTRAEVRAAVKSAWSAFQTSMKSARSEWKMTRDTAWKQFKTAVKNCKASSDISDVSNASSEVSGQ